MCMVYYWYTGCQSTRHPVDSSQVNSSPGRLVRQSTRHKEAVNYSHSQANKQANIKAVLPQQYNCRCPSSHSLKMHKKLSRKQSKQQSTCSVIDVSFNCSNKKLNLCWSSEPSSSVSMCSARQLTAVFSSRLRGLDCSFSHQTLTRAIRFSSWDIVCSAPGSRSSYSSDGTSRPSTRVTTVRSGQTVTDPCMHGSAELINTSR